MNFFQTAVENLLQAFQPVITAADDEYTRRALLEALDLPLNSALPAIPTNAIQNIENFLDNVPDPQLNDFLTIVPDLLDVADAVRAFANSAVVEAALADPLDAVQKAFEAAVSVLTIHLLKNAYPVAYCVLRMIQVIETKLTDHWSEELHVERIGKLLTSAHSYFHDILPLENEDDAKSTSDAVFKPLAALAGYLQDRAIQRTARPVRPFYGTDLPPETPPSLTATVAEAVSKRALTFGLGRHNAEDDIDITVLFSLAFVPANHGGPGLMLAFLGSEIEVSLARRWTVKATLSSDTTLSLWWMFGSNIKVLGSEGASLAVEVSRTSDPSTPPLSMPLFGGTRFEMGDVSFRVEASGSDIDARLTVHNAALIAGAAAGDSFIRSVTPSNGARADVDLILGISREKGVYIGATAGLTATFALNKTIGPVHLDVLSIEVRPATNGDIRLAARLTLSIEIGPVTASIDGVGMRADISFPKSGGNLGVLDLKPDFQPPRGVGIVIDAAAITGGGYLFFDEDAGRYAGVLQLEMWGISVKAVGILDTKLPGGMKGYSFLIIISAEFSPIQLGLGFTLNGVGGLAGIHRTFAIAPLQASIRAHAVDDVLFPKDPVKNASRIISDLQRFFPPLTKHYIFGPMALIGWGTPTLLTVKLGIILELPPPLRIVLLGQLDCTLPDPASAVVDLHVDVLGVLDFGAKTFALDGTIHDSRIGPYSLSGDFAVRMRWGNDPTFALSIGGFNPHFHQIPAGFPSLQRLTLALGGNNPRLTLQFYFALTSNSLQLGARAELYAEAEGFSVTGWVGFDALIIFHPFGFRVDLSAGFLLRRGSKSLGGIDVEATLTGPSPWHVWGEATISILFFDVSVSFDVSIGDGAPGALPSTNIWPVLQGAIQTNGNWSGVLPPAAAQVVSLKQPVDADGTPHVAALIDPVGRITLVERVAPLQRTISKFDDASPAGTRLFNPDHVKVGTKSISGWTTTIELFPPAQFEALSDDQKLSRPSFERMAAGVALPDAVTVGIVVPCFVQYATTVVDAFHQTHDGSPYDMPAALQQALTEVGSAAKGGMSASTQPYITPGSKPPVTLDEETYVVASAGDLHARLDVASAGTKGAVIAALDEYLANHAAERSALTVVAAYEAAA